MIDRLRNRFSLLLVAALVCAMFGATGCTTTSEQTEELTADQQAAVDDVVAEIASVASVLASFIDLVDPQTLLAGEGYGDCPIVSTVASQTELTVTFDYGDGCTNGLYGDEVVAGQVTGTLAIVARTVMLEFVDFAIGEDEVVGTISIALSGEGSAATLTGDVDITTGDGGSVVGSITFAFTIETGVVIITDATLEVKAGGSSDTYEVTATNLVIDPSGNGNFIPESGTVAFEVPNTAPGGGTIAIVVTFTSQSPVDGTVQVKVGPAPAVPYQIPGV